MASLIERYHQWRRRTFPASKEDVAWRHDFLNARLDSLGARFDSVDRRLNEIGGSLNVTPDHTRLEPLFESLRRRAQTLIDGGQRMNYYSSESPDGLGYWPLSEEECPCDVHFREYLASRDIGGKSIFHFGTGAHHFVGAGELGRGNPNYVLAVTASPEEHADYIDLIIGSPRLARFYKVIFTDIYTLDGASLPAFDIVTLFHLCEYWDPVKSAYAPLDDRKLLGLMIEKLKPGGQIIAYTRSRSWDKAWPLFEAAVAAKALRAAEPFKTLNVYAKV